MTGTDAQELFSAHCADFPRTGGGLGARLRAQTHPYSAMLAICSDLDMTPDRHVYAEIMRFLNTTQTTAMGPGVGLEVGNSIYFDMPPNQFAYRTTDDAGRAMVRDMIHSGHIDCLHSYGDLAVRRDDAKRALDELSRHECWLKVWVDHSKARTNFGPDIMVGSGDVVGSEAYHADLTLQYGIGYVWRGRTTAINGQNAPITPRVFADMLTLQHPLASTRSMLKEAVKVRLGRKGHPRWEMYGANRVVRPSTLRDGQPIWEFLRSNPFWDGSGRGDTGTKIGDVLTRRMLETLIRRQGFCILYTHLGKVRDPRCPFEPSGQQAFRLLADFYHNGQILVLTTHRVLRYLTVRDNLQYACEREGGTLKITIDSVSDPVCGRRVPAAEELQGLTFVAERCDRVELRLRDDEAIKHKMIQQEGNTLITVPWQRLEYPQT